MSSPVVVLKNGVRIANFSSPHPFVFDDGTELPACDPERSRKLLLQADEQKRVSPSGLWMDVELQFRLTAPVTEALNELEADDAVDIVLVPLPVLQAMKSYGKKIGKCRVCRVADRVSKVICANVFCT